MKKNSLYACIVGADYVQFRKIQSRVNVLILYLGPKTQKCKLHAAHSISGMLFA